MFRAEQECPCRELTTDISIDFDGQRLSLRCNSFPRQNSPYQPTTLLCLCRREGKNTCLCILHLHWRLSKEKLSAGQWDFDRLQQHCIKFSGFTTNQLSAPRGTELYFIEVLLLCFAVVSLRKANKQNLMSNPVYKMSFHYLSQVSTTGFNTVGAQK